MAGWAFGRLALFKMMDPAVSFLLFSPDSIMHD